MANLLIPVQRLVSGGGKYKFPKTCVLTSIHAEDDLPLGQLAAELKRAGVRARVVLGRTDASVTLRRDRNVGGGEAYRLTVGKDGVEIVSKTAAGAYYGVQTLREMIRAKGTRLAECRIQDSPSFQRRGVYLDCARGKVPTVATLKAVIERLASWKINEFQLYIENAFTFKKHPLISRGFSPYTPNDLKEVQRHAQLHHIRLVPSLTTFGHMDKILAIPKYGALGELPGHHGLPGGTTLCPGDPRSIRLVADMFDEFLPIFDAEDFNACGDEPWELGQGRSKSRAKRIGTGRVYLEFILKLREQCIKHGKRMNIWGDIVLKHPEIIPDIPKDIVMLNWDYSPNGNRIERTGEFTACDLPLVCCPGTHGWQSHGTRMRTSVGNVSNFARVALKHRAEGYLNTDWGDGGHRNTLGVSLAGYAHGAAHSWNTRGVDDKKHLRNFTFHVFGDRNGKLAKALRVLGDCDASWPYHALTEALAKPKALVPFFSNGRPVIDKHDISDSAVERRLSRLGEISWPDPAKGLDEFEKIALREFGVATEMERLAWERYDLVRKVRAGTRVPKAAVRKHASAYKRMSDSFARVWMMRNRPSRLKDNMAGFKKALKEMVKYS